MTNKSIMTNIRHDYADKYWLEDTASESIAWVVICAIIAVALWWLDVAIWAV